MKQFLKELKRRNVYRVGATYLVTAFVVVQLAGLAGDAFGLPGWFEPMAWVVCGLGFPIALVLAWAFQMTPEGVRRTLAREAEPEGPDGGGITVWAFALVGLLLAGGGAWYLAAGGEGQPSTAAGPATDTARSEDIASARFAPHDRPFVAVLPLENLSPEEENQFFAAGMHEEILNQLGKVSGLGVFARTTMSQYADTDQAVVEIGRELGAEAVLEGSVRRAAGRVRISVQLIDPDTRDHLWSEIYERELSPKAIFDIQADIAERIASALQTELAASERTRIAEPPTQNLAAYDAYLRGRDRLWRYMAERRPVLVDSAVADLQQAVAADTTFAQAHGLLGSAYAFRFARSRDPSWKDSARAATRRAERLQPGLPEAHLARGVLYLLTDSLEAAERASRRFLERRPDHPLALIAMAIVHGPGPEADRLDRLRWRLRMLRRDPRNVVIINDLVDQLSDLELHHAAEAWRQYGLKHHPENRALEFRRVSMLRDQGRYREALDLLRALPGNHPATAGYLQLKVGHPEEALRLLQQAGRERMKRAEASPTASGEAPEWWQGALGYAHLRAGDEERGRSLLQQTADSLRAKNERSDDRDPVGLAQLAQMQHALGRTATARDDLGLAVRDLWVLRPLRSPIFDSVRDESWFQQYFRQAEANLEARREKVRQMDLDLYPPGVEPDTAS